MREINYMKIKNITDTKADIMIYGDIVGEGWRETDICPADIIDRLKKVGSKDLDIYINSGGGNVFAGIAIYNLLKRHRGKKTVYIDAVAGSIASVIAMAGDDICMYKNSFLVIHKPTSAVDSGNAEDFRKCADELDNIQNTIQEIYKSRLKNESYFETVIDMINEETWLNAEKAAEYFNIKVLDENKAAAAVKTAAVYKNAPKGAENIFKGKNDYKPEKKLRAELDLLCAEFF